MARLWGRSDSSDGAGGSSATERVGTEVEAEPGAGATPAAGVRDDSVRGDAIHDDTIRDHAAREGAIRDDAIRDHAARDSAVRDDVIRDDVIQDVAQDDAIYGDQVHGATDRDARRGDALQTDVFGVFGDAPSATGNRLDWPTLNWSAVNWSVPNWASMNSSTGQTTDRPDAAAESSESDGSPSYPLPAGVRAELARRSLADVWARPLRRVARVGVWTLPLAAACIALAGMWGWPTPADPSGGGNGGSWLVLTLAGLTLLVMGVVSVAALLVATPAGRWAVGATIGVVSGSILLAPVLGLVGLARPAGAQLGELGAGLEQRLFESAVSRWLGVGGLILLAVGGLALGCAILAAGVLNTGDGWLVLGAVALAVGSAYTGWEFLLVIAALCLLAASLGLAWTASRLTPDGVLRD